jgi:4-hydroxy-3-methylbut-2-enyl diphosphate reductase
MTVSRPPPLPPVPRWARISADGPLGEGAGAVRVLEISPRGYCYGVVDALTLAQRVAADPAVPRPIHVLGMIVHNRHVVADLARQGIVTLDGADRGALLEQVREGSVIFTAHGVSPEVKRRARERGLCCFDATCPDVTRTHEVIADRAARGFQIVYIGRKGHPEPEGAMGVAPGAVHLVETEEDLDALRLPEGPVAIVTQTTLSQWDTEALIAACRRRFPEAEVWNEICLATQVRQQAVAEQAREADLVLVVGDERSNNSNRLVQVAREVAGRPAHRIDSVEAIRPEWLEGVGTVAVTAGSSTPSQLTNQVVSYLRSIPDGAPPPPPGPRAALRLPGAGRRT